VDVPRLHNIAEYSDRRVASVLSHVSDLYAEIARHDRERAKLEEELGKEHDNLRAALSESSTLFPRLLSRLEAALEAQTRMLMLTTHHTGPQPAQHEPAAPRRQSDASEARQPSQSLGRDDRVKWAPITSKRISAEVDARAGGIERRDDFIIEVIAAFRSQIRGSRLRPEHPIITRYRPNLRAPEADRGKMTVHLPQQARTQLSRWVTHIGSRLKEKSTAGDYSALVSRPTPAHARAVGRQRGAGLIRPPMSLAHK
jgi:hypothetical protein